MRTTKMNKEANIDELAELLRMNNAIDDQEIEKRLQDLSGIQRTPEEVKEKELTEAFIKAKEKKD